MARCLIKYRDKFTVIFSFIVRSWCQNVAIIECLRGDCGCPTHVNMLHYNRTILTLLGLRCSQQCDVTPCSHLGGMCRLLLQGRRVSERSNQQVVLNACLAYSLSPKMESVYQRTSIEVHGVTIRKITLLIFNFNALYFYHNVGGMIILKWILEK
jgi:hypothetical protein